MSRHARGIALLIVLWAVALLAVLLGGYVLLTRSSALEARTVLAQTRARYAAEAGMARAVLALREPDPQRRWVADGRDYSFPFDGFRVHVRIIDVAGLVDLNAATPAALRALLRAAGDSAPAAAALAAAIEQRRTPPPPAGLTDARADRDRQGPFITRDALLALPGMDAALYARIAPALTLWSGRNQPDPAYAPALALATLPGLDLARAEAYVQARWATPAGAPLPRLPGAVAPPTAGSSGVVAIDAEAVQADGTRASVHATVRLLAGAIANRTYAVLRWREGDQP